MSLRSRLLAAALALVALGLLVADVATYSALRAYLHDRTDSQLDETAVSVERALRSRDELFADATLGVLSSVAPGVYVQVRDLGSGRAVTLAGGRPGEGRFAPRLPDDLAALARPLRRGGGSRLLTVPAADDRGGTYRVRVSPLRPGSVLVVALPLDDIGATLNRLVVVAALVTVAVLAAAALAGLYLVRLGLRPLVHIEATAATIAAGDLSRRVPVDDDRTEVGRLGRALNVMLERIDQAFAMRRASEEGARRSEQRMRRFVADASHELRTPVAAVRAYAELYRLGADQRPEDLARLLSGIEAESARMGRLVEDLLLLTRLDEGRPLERQPVDLGALAADAVTAARALDPDRPVELSVEGSVEVSGDRDRLRQVIDNLLANVRAHTEPGTPTAVRVFAADGAAVLEVADSGAGLAAEDLGRVFERFYRADQSRTRTHADPPAAGAGGSGLGLSIVAAIVSAHGGAVAARNADGGGAVFRMSLPLLPAAH